MKLNPDQVVNTDLTKGKKWSNELLSQLNSKRKRKVKKKKKKLILILILILFKILFILGYFT